jgi:catechol 2,3-dioxygenase-like lactoylglutathione lyase family enzyme
MSKNPFQHIDLRVSDMQAASKFYSKFLPAIGFTREESGGGWKVFYAEGTPPSAAWFAFVEDESHRPNSNRIAFWAASREEVDRLGSIVREAGAINVSGPRSCPEYGPTYYAAFFEDPSRNKLEICHVEE